MNEVTTFIFASVPCVAIGSIPVAVDKLGKSLESDGAKIQALFAEIRDKLGK